VENNEREVGVFKEVRMKALILNSGLGSRMKGLRSCKCLMELTDGVTVLDAQVEALMRCGVSEFIVTTGSNADVLKNYAIRKFPEACFKFIHNSKYAETNYIYSIYLAREDLLGEDILLLHGDLGFEQNVLQDVIASTHSVMVTDTTKPLPEKDFKAVVRDGKIVYVGVDIPGDMNCDAVYSQPLYKLIWRDWEIWLDEMTRFCESGKTGVYAENALNLVSGSMNLFALDIFGRMCFEVDNDEDLEHARVAFRRMPERLQTVYAGCGYSEKIQNILADLDVKKPFVVSDLPKYVGKNGSVKVAANAIYFDSFTSNPNVFEIMSGIKLFKEQDCDCIVSIGGGSAIDVAKCINMLRGDKISELMDSPRGLHLAVPTTAGTGSESTCFAVAYDNKQKLSYEHSRMMPDYVILDPQFLDTLPPYHKKSALLDATCQAIESLWAKGQTDESRAYALSAIRIIAEDIDEYFTDSVNTLNSPERNDVRLRILQAANLSGKAINIGKTTAAHAMSYRLSTIFGLTHGHAAALCLKPVWKHIIDSGYSIKFPLSLTYDCFVAICNRLDMAYHFAIDEGKIEEIVRDLVSSVNAQRLGNHPVELSENILTDMYHKILCGRGE